MIFLTSFCGDLNHSCLTECVRVGTWSRIIRCNRRIKLAMVSFATSRFMCMFRFITALVENILFQNEVVERAGPEALELGLLFGTEIPQEEEMDALCFQHLVLQEFAVAGWLSRQDIVS